ncbi:MAG: right-handed parallel beta-helix repeat-containing protein [Gimesia chilikensis]|uniref:right-handed parallel beta-helix repeat-containing protein n=1 Tax=Gimesia chilikensis TaxID=2605989 RepID=UPI0037A9B08A
MRSLTMPSVLLFSLFVSVTTSRAQNNQPFPMVTAGQSIQAALDAQPGRMLFLPAGDYEISEKLVIRSDRSGLFGPGRIIQTNPAAPFIEVEHRKGVQFRDLVLTRPEDKQTTAIEAINLRDCQDLVLDNVTVLNHRTRSGVFYLHNCRNATIRNCTITNYMRIAVDDRTASPDWGYAFHCIDGTGIVVNASTGTLIQGNRITETELLPTPAVQQQHQLGQFVKKNETKGTLTSQETWERESVKNWHQGSAIIVTSPTASDRSQILGNTIENGAQGIDLHSDHVIVAQNIVSNCFVGMKAMHGSRNVVIIGNQFIKNDLWSIGLMPGAASHAARQESPSESARDDNGDGGSIIANNIISQFGFGNAHWIWGSQGNPILLDAGQKPDNPPLADVVIQGNIVQNSARFHPDKTEQGPRYVYAIRIARKATGIHLSNNLFDPGREGISNVELEP